MAKKKTKGSSLRIDRNTRKRTIGSVRKVIEARLKQLNKSRHWLAEEMGVRPATVYDFIAGRTAASGDTIERMLDVLGLEIRPKE
jgi:plasmid maintenance system antidote protein VapI